MTNAKLDVELGARTAVGALGEALQESVLGGGTPQSNVTDQTFAGDPSALDEAARGGSKQLSPTSQTNGRAPADAPALARLVRATRRGLQFSPRTPYQIWSAVGVRIAGRSDATRWWLGDWLVFGERHYGQRYRLAIRATGLDYQTLRNYAVVARRFSLYRRRDNLSFQHHAEVCPLPEQEQDRWLDLAAENHWSRRELRVRLRRVRDAEESPLNRHILRIEIEPERERRWREVAARSRCSLEEWMVLALDAAASST